MPDTEQSLSVRYGPWALVTGAAQGIGAALCDELVAGGMSIVLVDRDADAMRREAARMRDAGVEAVEVLVDLAEPLATDQVLAATDGLDVGLFASNAAIQPVIRFTNQTLDSKLAQLDVNCRVPLVLAHHLLPPMIDRGRGALVFLSSGAGLRGTPLVSAYAATKAWNLVLAESLWAEVGDLGVDVLAVVPGNVRTPGWQSSSPSPGALTDSAMEPRDVAVEIVAALGEQPTLVPGEGNRAAQAFMAQLDRADAIALGAQAMRETYPDR